MESPRSAHSALLLSNGTALVIGGAVDFDTPLSTAEIFDFDTRLWNSAGSMKEARMDHSAVQLKSGEVYVTGGFGLNPVDSIEVYRPGGGGWSTAESIVSDLKLKVPALFALQRMPH